jgi:hypothetical protein
MKSSVNPSAEDVGTSTEYLTMSCNSITQLCRNFGTVETQALDSRLVNDETDNRCYLHEEVDAFSSSGVRGNVFTQCADISAEDGNYLNLEYVAHHPFAIVSPRVLYLLRN